MRPGQIGDYNGGLVRALLLAFQFLTILPFPVSWSAPPAPGQLARAAALYPLMGAALGLLALAVDTAGSLLWPAPVRAALVLAVLVVVTGALHLDGFLDSCDGLFLWRPERRLEAMRDSRVGGFAVAGGLALYGIKLAVLATLLGQGRVMALLLMPIVGRLSMVLAAGSFPAARPDGLGSALQTEMRVRHVAVAGALAVAACAAWGLAGAMTLAIAVGVTFLAGRFITGRIGGMTGDTFGFVCEVVETVTLLTIQAIPMAWVGWGQFLAPGR